MISITDSTASLHPLSLVRDLCSAQTWSRWVHDDPLSAVLTVVALLMWFFIARFVIALALALLAAPVRHTPSGERLSRTATAVAPRWVRPLIVGLVAVPILGTSVAAGASVVHSQLPSLDRAPASDVARPSRDAARAPIVGAEPPGALASPASSPAPSTSKPTHVAATHTVVPGECLWRIAESELGPQASDAQIAARWPQWWKANAAVIGDNPDLILPGQQLTPPAQDGATS